MKAQRLILASLLGGMILLAGCQKEGKLFEKNGGQFRFGAKSNAVVMTRATYGDLDATNKHQKITWGTEDDIRVYSKTASRRIAVEQADAAGNLITPESTYHWADYKIIPDATDPTKATIENINNDGNYTADQVGTNANGNPDLGNGLAWQRGKEDIEHTFYAVYPAVKQRGVEEDEGMGIANVPGTSGEIALWLPDTQAFSEKGNLEQYGYMTAYAKGSASATGGNISLDFYPAFTAFEISIRSEDAAIALTSFQLSAANDAPVLTGDYTANYDAAGARTFDCTEAEGRSISVNLSGKSAPAASENKDLVFTVLALPQDLTGLTASFTFGGNTRSLKLNYSDSYTGTDDGGNPLKNQPVIFTGGNKHRIYGLVLSNGELLISVETAPWLAGGEDTYTTIENVSTIFESYQRYNENQNYGQGSWSIPNYVAIAPGRATDEYVDPDATPLVPTNRPLHSPMLTLNTVSVDVALQLRSDNENVGFVVAGEDGSYGAPTQTLDIRASDDLDDTVVTTYFVVPLDDSAIGEIANISLIRMDCGVPIAYSHSDMPGTTDHTKVPFMVLSVSDFNSKTHTEVPSL